MGQTEGDKRGGGQNAPGRQERIEWLMRHQELWRDYPPDEARTDEHFDWPGRDALLVAMKRDGVLSYSTYGADVRLTALIAAARHRLRSA
jgi:hypothetical protein